MGLPEICFAMIGHAKEHLEIGTLSSSRIPLQHPACGNQRVSL